MPSASTRRAVWAWALYDWADSAFATTVMAGFFPVYFKTWSGAGVPAAQSTAQLGIANSIGVLAVAVLAPILGAIADAGSYKKRFLAGSMLIGAAATAALGALGQGDWRSAVVLYAVAGTAFASSLCFYDSLLTTVADAEHIDFVSALGYALGYVGGGTLFALNVWMFQRPDLFGLPDGISAMKASFVMVGLWWAVFSIPLLRWVPEPRSGAAARGAEAVRQGWSRLKDTFSHLRHRRMVLWFLAAFYLYNDGVGTTMKMAIDYGLSIGLRSGHLILALLMVQFVGFPATLVFGRLASRLHPKKAIYICLAAYVLAILWAVRMTHSGEFFILAGIIGCVQGGVQALSRSYYARLIPAGSSAEFYGFYNLMSKFSGLVGPAVVGALALSTGNPRLAILSIAAFFVLGGLLLRNVDEHATA